MKSIDISGQWRYVLDQDKKYENMPMEEWYKNPQTIDLPDSINHALIGEKKDRVETGFLNDEYEFGGNVWFSKEICLSEGYSYMNSQLFIEKSRITKVFFDGQELDTIDSLCTPHRHQLGNMLIKGTHRIDICVNNTDYKTKGGHMTSPDTQTNWIGILGRVELQMREEEHIEDMNVYSSYVKPGEAKVRITAKTAPEYNYKLLIDGAGVHEELEATSDENGLIDIQHEIKGENIFWDEYNRNLLTARIILENDESEEVTFGIRTFEAQPLKLLVNGRELFLRGKHDGMVFPLTGYAPMDEESWEKIFITAKEYGINHYRFHTCCPPDAAFTAADKVGIYLEPELPFWGTIADKDDKEYNAQEQEYLIEEGRRILKEYGNHPSFFMMSMGNELWGSHKRIGEFLNIFKNIDSRHLYTGGSNNFQFYPTVQEGEDVLVAVRFSKDRLFRGSYAMCDAPLGIVQTNVPSSDNDFDWAVKPKVSSKAASSDGYIEIQYGTGVKKVKAGESNEIMKPMTPVISHEIGQYYFYPDFESEKKYTGNLKPTFLKAYRETLEKSGVYDRHKAFFRSAGMLSVACYKMELEAQCASRSLSGFQLLDLQDFMGQDIALVGVLDAFYDNKGLVTASRWRESCADNMIIGRMDKFVYSNNEKVNVKLQTVICRPEKYAAKELMYVLTDEYGEVLTMNTIKLPSIKNRVEDIGNITLDLSSITKPTRATLILKMLSDISEEAVTNHYEIYVYPDLDVAITNEYIEHDGRKVVITDSVEAAKKLINEGTPAICVPKMQEEDIEGFYAADFWNYSMFSKISRSMGRKEPVGTLGLCITENDPLCDAIRSRDYSTPQWYNIVSHSHSVNLPADADVKMVAETIDNPVRGKRLGLMYYQDGVPVIASRLWEIADKPEVKTLAATICNLFTKAGRLW